MAKLVVVITSHSEKWYDIAKAWEKNGAPGVTIIRSHGLYQLDQKANVELDMATFSIAGIMRQLEETSRMILSIVPEELVDRLIDTALEIINLEDPYTGIAFVLDLERVVGLRGTPK
jgi:nitrogen regulatory protein PII